MHARRGKAPERATETVRSRQIDGPRRTLWRHHGIAAIDEDGRAIGGRYASPVVLPPTVAILGAGRSRDAVVARDGEMVIRHILPLSLTFDHRAVTGGEATRFMNAVIRDLEARS